MSPELKDLLPLIAVSISSLSLISTWIMFGYMRRIDTRKASEQRIKEAEAKSDERHRLVLRDIEALEEKLGGRIAVLERDIETTLSHDDLRELYEKINRVAEETSRLNGELHETSQTLRTLTAQIMKRGLA